MFPKTDKSWRDYRALNQNWSYQPTLAGRAIPFYSACCQEVINHFKCFRVFVFIYENPIEYGKPFCTICYIRYLIYYIKSNNLYKISYLKYQISYKVIKIYITSDILYSMNKQI